MTARRYVTVIQAPEGYPPPGDLEPKPSLGPPHPVIHTVVLAEDYEAEVERLKAVDEGIAADRDEARALVRRFVDLYRDKDGGVLAQPGASECDDLLIEAMGMLERVGR
jgi:hypothetical protein